MSRIMEPSDGIQTTIDSIFDEVDTTSGTPDFALTALLEEAAEFGIREPQQSAFVDTIFRAGLRRRLCHDVLPIRSRDEGVQLLAEMRQRRYHGQLFIVSYHGESPEWQHLHVVHDCGWTAGTCRCTTFRGLPFQRRRRSQWTGGIGRDYLRALGIYMFLHPRECLHYFFAGAQREIPGAAEIDSHDRREESAEGTAVDEADEIGAVCRDTVDGPSVSTPGRIIERCQKKYSSKSTPQKNQTLETILAFFEKYPVCPLLSTCKTAQWCENDKLRGVGRSSLVYQQAIDIFQRIICNKTISELIEFYLNSQPLFACTSSHLFDFYYTVYESRAKLYDLLQYQCNYDEEFITFFYKRYITF